LVTPPRTGAPVAELADLLDLALERVKLVRVSACWSATLTVAEQRRLLRLPALEQQPDRELEPEQTAERRTAGGLAAELAARLGCGVLAMRYPAGLLRASAPATGPSTSDPIHSPTSGTIRAARRPCAVSIIFTDAAGNRWERDPSGALKPTPPDPVPAGRDLGPGETAAQPDL
jgi:hypothetical protein